ncbi:MULTISPECIES: hypothetical protein [Burkholderia]|uniref:hypothetical protein n=1 Tax=Burkholderia TaxID=32008 RepID=UPI000AB374FB|nr:MULTISPECIES: hypothetical protein [Burkholderia]
MGSSAVEAYEACGIGQHSSMRPAEAGVNGLEAFQHDVAVADRLEREGKIRIRQRHKEDHTGQGYIDLILFERLF